VAVSCTATPVGTPGLGLVVIAGETGLMTTGSSPQAVSAKVLLVSPL
jgi:hypothetical protein